jgi:hypothetical protein
MKHKNVYLIVLLLAASVRLAAVDTVTLFRVFLNDGTAVVSYGEFARVGDRVVFSMPIGASGASSPAPALHMVNIPAAAVDWAATAKYAESARYAHYIATNAEGDYSTLTGEVASVLNSIAFTKDPKARLNLAVTARQRLASWPREHYGYRANDVRQLLGMLDEAISALRVAAGETAFSLDLIADVDPPAPPPVLPDPTPAESIEQALAVARVTDVPADRISLLGAVVAAIGDPRNAIPQKSGRSIRQQAMRMISNEVSVDKRYSKLVSSSLKHGTAAAASADVRGVSNVIDTVRRRDARMGSLRTDTVNGLLSALNEKLDSARRLRLARDRWNERVGALRAYLRATAPVVLALRDAQHELEAIKSLAGSEATVLVELSARFSGCSRILSATSVPDEFKPSHSLLVSALNLADTAMKTRRQAVVSGEINAAWDASSAAAGSMMLFAKAQEDMEATVKLPQIR